MRIRCLPTALLSTILLAVPVSGWAQTAADSTTDANNTTDTNSTDTSRSTTTTATDTARSALEDSGFDPGWIGLAGLIGLFGLMPRDRRDRPVTAGSSTTVSREHGR